MKSKVHRVELKAVAGERLEQKLRSKALQVKATADAGNFGKFEGYAAVFDELHPTSSWDLMWRGDGDWQDRFVPGCFDATLAEYAARGTKPSMLYMHCRGDVVGGYESLSADAKGLAVVGDLHKAAQTDSCVPIYDLMKLGALDGLSIGFRASKYALDEQARVRDIIEVDLSEISIVDIPGDDGARVTDVKARTGTIEFAERALRDAGFSRREAKAILAEGFRALRDAEPNDDPTQRDAGEGAETAASTDLDELLARFERDAKVFHP